MLKTPPRKWFGLMTDSQKVNIIQGKLKTGLEQIQEINSVLIPRADAFYKTSCDSLREAAEKLQSITDKAINSDQTVNKDILYESVNRSVINLTDEQNLLFEKKNQITNGLPIWKTGKYLDYSLEAMRFVIPDEEGKNNLRIIADALAEIINNCVTPGLDIDQTEITVTIKDQSVVVQAGERKPVEIIVKDRSVFGTDNRQLQQKFFDEFNNLKKQPLKELKLANSKELYFDLETKVLNILSKQNFKFKNLHIAID